MRCVSILSIVIILISYVSAELIISPNPLEIPVKIDTDTTFNITLQNTFNFNISNFEFSNLSGFTFPTEIILKPNESKRIDFNVLKNSLDSTSILSQVSFKYLVDIPTDPTTYSINITNTGFNPNYITIHNGDTIIWHNNDDITHTVTSSQFDYDVPVNGTIQHTFTTIGDVPYQDLTVFWGATINVISKDSSQLVHNPNYDKILTVQLDVYSDPTNLSILEVSKENFTIEVGQKKDGYLIIENTGSEIAQKIHLDSTDNWIEYNTNNFNLDPGEKKAINFEIIPLVINTNQTDKNHSIIISAKALNTEEETKIIEVFVPYKEFDESDPAYILSIIEDFCNRNPNNAFCNTPNSTTNVIVNDPTIPVNLTVSEVYAMLKRIQSIADSNQRADNKLNSLDQLLAEKMPLIEGLLNETKTNQDESEDRRETNERIFWIGMIFVVLIIGFILVYNVYEKHKRNQYKLGITK